jgi:hypothetical protein
MGVTAFSIRHKDYVTRFKNHLILHGVPPNVLSRLASP